MMPAECKKFFFLTFSLFLTLYNFSIKLMFLFYYCFFDCIDIQYHALNISMKGRKIAEES